MMISRSHLISKALFWLSVFVFLGASGSYLFFSRSSSEFLPSASVFPLLVVYCIAHGFRALRLGVLLGAGQVRKLLGLYIYTAACSAIIPFKLGELVRVNEIAWWTGSYWRGLLIVWIERVFDVVAIGAMALFIVATGAQEPKEIGLLLWSIGGFVFLTILFFFIVPEQLCNLNLHVIRSYKGHKAVNILRILDTFYLRFEQVKPLFSGKLVTLSLLTFFIWATELLAVFLLFESTSWVDAVTSLVRQFATVLGAHMTENPAFGGALAEFQKGKTLSLIGAGLAVLFFYWKYRFGTGGRRIER
jgi:hypothetical protein